VSSTSAPLDRDTHAIRIESLAVALVVFVLYALLHSDPVATLGRLYDDSVYLSIGKSIAEGHGYRSAQLVGTPVHVKFPPLLPAIYAIGWWLTSGSLTAVAAMALWLNIVVTAACAGTLWWLARRELSVGPIPATLFVITPLLTTWTMFYFSGAMSEPWMLLGWTVSLILLARLTRRHAARAPVIATAVALGVTLAATVLVRSQGLAVAAGIIAGALFSRSGWKALGVTIGAMLAPLVAWNLWHAAAIRRGPVSPLPDQTSYASWFPLGSVGELTDFMAIVARVTVPVYWRSTATILAGWESPKTFVLTAGFFVAAVIGLIVVARRAPAFAASVMAIVCLLIIWPYTEYRFLTPVLPMLGLAAAVGTQRILDRLPRLARRIALAGAAAVGLFLLSFHLRTRVDAKRGVPTSAFVRTLNDISRWVAENTRPDEHIMTPWGGVIYLRTGRLTAIENPEEPAFASSVSDAPRQFYASRLLADSVDVIVMWKEAPGRSTAWFRAMGVRCPGLLTEVRNHPRAMGDSADLHFYRVRRDLPCLQRFARGEAVPWPLENKNAP